jgi:hypothetical protein
MTSIHCCGGMHKCRTFHLAPQEGYVEARLLYLENCPVCEHTVAVLVRIDIEEEKTAFRKINKKARELFDRIKTCIMFEEKYKHPIKPQPSRFYLKYNEYGTVKKCYSNLYSLKIGLFDPDRGILKHLTGERIGDLA